MTYLKIIVPIPSVVKISKSKECFLRPSMIWHDLTPFSIALTQVSILGIIPPDMMPSSIKPGISLTLIFESMNPDQTDLLKHQEHQSK